MAWIRFCNSIRPEDPVPKDLLSCSGADVVCKWLCCFIQETKKENEGRYPATSLRSGIQRVLHSKKVPFNLFDKSDSRFRDLHNTLDTVSVFFRKAGVGAEVKYAGVISLDDEDRLWAKGVIGTASPWPLLRAAFYTVGLYFSLRGGQEHHDLKVSQMSRVPSTGYDKSTHYVYVENGSKNYQGRFSETGQSNKVVRAYAQPGSDRCPVLILDKYLSKLPPNAVSFYMQPMLSLPGDVQKPWFKNSPVGVNPLRSMMSKMSELAGLSTKYTNHSLRATSASRMFSSGVPEKIVAEMTGHKSLTALRQYERTTETQFQAVGQAIANMEQFTETMNEKVVTSVASVRETVGEKTAIASVNETVVPAPHTSQKASLAAQEIQKTCITESSQNCTINFNF